MTTINERARMVRLALKMTQAAFAEALNIKRNTVAVYEIGGRSPSPPVIQALCATFGVSKEWLEQGVGDMFVSEVASLEAIYSKSGGMSEMERNIIAGYFGLDTKGREVFIEYLVKMVNEAQAKTLDDTLEVNETVTDETPTAEPPKKLINVELTDLSKLPRSALRPLKLCTVSVIAAAAAGSGIDNGDTDRGDEALVEDKPRKTHHYRVRVIGDSLEPEIENGEIVFINKNMLDITNGNKIYAVRVDGEDMLKRIKQTKDGMFLIPVNPNYKTRKIREFEEVKVIGTVIDHSFDYKQTTD